MPVTHVFAGVAISELAVAEPWYQRFFGRPPDMRPHEHEVVWQLAQTGLIYVVQDPRAPDGRS